MNAEAGALLIVVWIPVAIVWLIVIVDLLRRSTMSTGLRWAWAIACTLVWPAMIAYLLMRPTRGRLEIAQVRTDPRARLVDAVLDREDGRIDEATWAATAAELRAR